jgi:ABC-type uncharacterized transport system permease subunit
VKEFVVYTLLRLVLLAATFGVIAGIWALVDGGFPWFPVLVLAFVVSGIASYFVLNNPRTAFASKVEQRATTTLERMRSKEDVD